MVSYVCSEKPLRFDFNWVQGYEFLSNKALDIYLERMMEHFEAEQREKTVKEKHWIKRYSRKEEV
ncbi:MAG: hypothetical protein QXZ02_00625 [Candidatus Bathyarchaeia archaeon]